MKYYVYYLVDPATGSPRYVGSTCKPQYRLAAHRCAAKKGHKPFHDWFNAVKPILLVKCVVQDKRTALSMEARLAASLRRTKHDIFNSIDDAGIAVHPAHSAETRRKLSAANVGQRRSAETCEAISKNKEEFFSDPKNQEAHSKRLKATYTAGRKPTIYRNVYTLRRRLAQSAAWTSEMREELAAYKRELKAAGLGPSAQPSTDPTCSKYLRKLVQRSLKERG